MRINFIEWDSDNRRHFGEHGRCREREVEDVLRARCHPTRVVPQSGSESRFQMIGQACSARYLVVVVVLMAPRLVRPITCWPLSGARLEKYLEWKRSLPR